MDDAQQDRASADGRHRAFLVPAVVCVLLGIACVTPAVAGLIWTDADGDGLPDTYNLFLFPGTTLVVDVWIDSQSFAFTSYQATLEQSGLTLLGAECLISGGTNAPIDSTSRANSLIFTGSAYDEQGVRLIGRIRYEVGYDCGFVRPVIDSEDAFPCRLSSNGGSEQFYFQTEAHTYTTIGEWFDPHVCCLPDGSCFITYESCECDAADGLDMGKGLDCEACATGVPSVAGSRDVLRVLPNPTSDVAHIAFRLEQEDEIDLAVYDASGRRMRSIVTGPMPVGLQLATWDHKDDNGRDIAPGTYFLRFTSSRGDQVTERVTIVR